MGRVAMISLGMVLWFSVVQLSDASEQQGEQNRDILNIGGDAPRRQRSKLSLPVQELAKESRIDHFRDDVVQDDHVDLKKSVSTSSAQETFPDVQAMSRLLVVPYSVSNVHAKQLYLSSNIMEDYPHMNVTRAVHILYVSRLRKILVATSIPQRIVSFNIDRPGKETVRDDILCYGMVLDKGRQLIFLTTAFPNTISRMTTRGRQFQRVVQLSRYNTPFSIALDPVNRKLYVANSLYVLSLGYDGGQLETLYTGYSIYAVVLNLMMNTLYFNDNRKMMRMSSSGTEVMEMYNLRYKAWKMVYYNNSLYVGGYSFIAREINIDIVALGDGNVTGYQRLQRFDPSHGLNICLLP